ncbi:MAG: twin-arginine translocation signal domain-containing protein [Paracoccaceae bacterium]
MTKLNRRKFLKTATATAGSAAAMSLMGTSAFAQD